MMPLIICEPWDTPMAKTRKGTSTEKGSSTKPNSCMIPNCQITPISEVPTTIKVLVKQREYQ
ncbi:hypothetical protein D3C76_1847590 [compost metagenome]